MRYRSFGYAKLLDHELRQRIIEFRSFYFLYSSLENSEAKEYHSEIQRILNQMGVAHSERKSKKRVQSPAPSVTEGDR